MKPPPTRMPYKPTARGEYKPNPSKDRMPEHAFGYLNTFALNIRIAAQIDHKTTDNPDGVIGEGIVLSLFKKGGNTRAVNIPLGEMTEAELVAARDFIAAAFEAALPIVQAKDKAATDAWEIDGDDSYYRQYRTAPVVALRNGPLGEYVTRSVERSAYVPRVVREGRDLARGDGATSNEVASGDEGNEVSSDDS